MEGTRSVFSFTRERSRQLAALRQPLSGEALALAVRQVLKLAMPGLQAAPQGNLASRYRILRPHRDRSYPLPCACTYAVPTEPGIMAIVYMLTEQNWISPPPQTGSRAILYVAHRSSDAELKTEPLIGEAMQAEPGSMPFTCDVRGMGESQPNTCGSNTFDDPYGCDYFYAIHSLMLDRPYLGQRTWDVLQVLEWLAANGYTDVHLIGKGWGALAATFAALLSERVTQVTLKHSLQSYAAVAESEEYHWPLAMILPNVLAHFDLPDCYRALEAKHLRQIEPWGPLGERQPA
jgi:hypothetical protein